MTDTKYSRIGSTIAKLATAYVLASGVSSYADSKTNENYQTIVPRSKLEQKAENKTNAPSMRANVPVVDVEPFVEASATENGYGAQAGIKIRFGSFKDLFTWARPSCWKHPCAQGGSLCEANPKNYHFRNGIDDNNWTVPVKSLAGKLALIGVGYALSSGGSGGSSGGDNETIVTDTKTKPRENPNPNPNPNPEPTPVEITDFGDSGPAGN